MEEHNVGIRAYTVPPAAELRAVLRHRYTDFTVAEIGPDMRVANVNASSSAAPEQQRPQTFKDPDAVARCVRSFTAVAGEENGQILERFLREMQNRADRQSDKAEQEQPVEGSDPPAAVFAEIADKQKRTAMHHFFRGLEDLPALVTDTISTGSGGHAVRLMAQSDLRASRKRKAPDQSEGSAASGRGKRARKRGGFTACGDIRGLHSWPGGSERPYVRFALQKENRESHAVVSSLARALGGGGGAIGMAGTKDKRAVTSQWLTAFKMPVTRLQQAVQGLRSIQVGSFHYTSSNLALGDLAGNAFTLVLRGLCVLGGSQSVQEAVAAAASALKHRGFVNYFGLQRFGAGARGTHEIGFALVKGDWQAAVDALLTGRGDDKPEVAQGLDAARRGCYDEALKLLPGHLTAERAVVIGLNKQGKNAALNALQAIPRKLRMMYMHAAQSYLWNAAASKRIEDFGTVVQPGDLVLPMPAWPDGGSAEDPIEGLGCGPAVPKCASQHGAVVETSATDAPAQKPTSSVLKQRESASDRIGAVRRVTTEDVRMQRYSIDQVVLPLPGGQVEYPGEGHATHEASSAYTSVASSLGVSLSESRHEVPEFSLLQLTGDYRRLIVKPRAFAYHYVQHPHQDDELIDTGCVRVGRPRTAEAGSPEGCLPQKSSQGHEGSSERQAGLCEAAPSQGGRAIETLGTTRDQDAADGTHAKPDAVGESAAQQIDCVGSAEGLRQSACIEHATQGPGRVAAGTAGTESDVQGLASGSQEHKPGSDTTEQPCCDNSVLAQGVPIPLASDRAEGMRGRRAAEDGVRTACGQGVNLPVQALDRCQGVADDPATMEATAEAGQSAHCCASEPDGVSAVQAKGTSAASVGMLKNAYSAIEGSCVDVHGGGQYLALVMSFALPPSAFATMLVRQFMGINTATAEHKAASMHGL